MTVNLLHITTIVSAMFSSKKPYTYWFKSKWTSVFPFRVSRDKFNRSYNNFDDTFGRINVPNETEDVNKILFDIITKKMTQRDT